MTKRDMPSASDYTAESIDVLDDLDHIRLRPAMYIQDIGSAGFHQLIKEAIDNGVDEFLAGHAQNIWLDIHSDSSISITDDGRGIPTEIHPKTGISTLTSIFVKLHTGGKFDDQAYKVSAGLHGVGIKATNALSEWLEVTTVRPCKPELAKGQALAAWKQQFERGIPTTEVERTKRDIASTDTGTKIRFKPDPQIFGNVVINVKLLATWLDNLSYLCPGLALHLGEQTFKQDEGLTALIQKRIGDNTSLSDVIIGSNEHIDVALAWTSLNGETWETFVNTSPTVDGGTHVTGAKKAITATLKEKASDSVYGDDLREGLYAVIHYKTSDPLFQGQTKGKLLNAEAESETYTLLIDTLSKYWDEHLDIAQALIRRAVEMARAKAQFKKKRAAIKRIHVRHKQKGILPGRLAEAPFCDPKDRELYICEGASAGGNAKSAREASFQEVLPLRGKVQNAARQELTTLLKNEEIRSIVMAIGAGIAEECIPSKSRVGKVLLLMDADPDGHHITALVLTFLVMYMRPVVEAGLIYVVDSPLFVGTYKQKRVYGHTLEEVKREMAGKGFITRLKGHGESSESELREYAMDSTTRKLLKVSISDEDEQIVLGLMGDDTLQRRTVLGI